MAKRPIGAPVVSPGPQFEFFMQMQDLVLRSGDLSLAEIAGLVNVQRQVVHRALRGPKLPGRALVLRIIDALLPGLDETDEIRAATKKTIIRAFNDAVSHQRRTATAPPEKNETSYGHTAPEVEAGGYSPQKGTGASIGAPDRRTGPAGVSSGYPERGQSGNTSGPGFEPSVRAAFADRLTQLWQAAGNPTLSKVAEMTDARPRAARGSTGVVGRPRVSMQRISDWRVGRSLPRQFDAIQPVLAELIKRAEVQQYPVAAELIDMRAWQRLWAAAVAEPSQRDELSWSTKSTLPRDIPDFVGRSEELQRIVQNVVDKRVSLQTIGGMAGVGKTALAVHAAHMLAERFPDGRYFVELHAHTPGRAAADPSDVLAKLLTELGTDSRHMPDSLVGRRDLWRDKLAGKRILLILDDARDSTQLEPLLPPGEDCATLITTRRRLVALDGAVPLELDVLDLESAVRLFVTCARRDITSADYDAVREIVQLCGFLPLAIVLLAGQLAHHRSWTIRDLADGFAAGRDRLGELAAGERTVRAAFTMSYKVLSVRQKALFRLLGQQPDQEFDAHTVAELADLPYEIVRRELEALYTSHLIYGLGPGRYRLPDLVRDYARGLTELD